MSLLNIFKSKKRREKEKRDTFLLGEFDAGRIIHINDGVDNKEIFKKVIVEEKVLEEIIEEPIEEKELNNLPYIEPKKEEVIELLTKEETEWIEKVLILKWGEERLRFELNKSKYNEKRRGLLINYYRLKEKEQIQR